MIQIFVLLFASVPLLSSCSQPPTRQHAYCATCCRSPCVCRRKVLIDSMPRDNNEDEDFLPFAPSSSELPTRQFRYREFSSHLPRNHYKMESEATQSETQIIL